MPKTHKPTLKVERWLPHKLPHNPNFFAIIILSFVATLIAAITFLPQPTLKVKGITTTILTPSVPVPTPTHTPKLVALNPVAEPILNAKAIYVWNPKTNTVLLAKNPHLRLPQASTTKLMTALVALDEYPPGEVVTVKDADRSAGQSVHLVAGEQMTVENLLKSMLIYSGNDAAVALAQHHPQGYSYFVNLMNDKASNLGLLNTHFVNVSGIQEPEHYSTVYDLSHLGFISLQNEMINNIVQTQTTTITDITGQLSHPLANINELLGSVPGVKGIKTGWTQSAGECLITYVDRDSYSIIITILGSADRFGETKQLIDWAYQNYHLQ